MITFKYFIYYASISEIPEAEARLFSDSESTWNGDAFDEQVCLLNIIGYTLFPTHLATPLNATSFVGNLQQLFYDSNSKFVFCKELIL